ncbi:MAG: hypothetical protein RIR96_1316 [Bacteroidota bacterium]
MKTRFLFLFIACLNIPFLSKSQSLTGSWEGLTSDEYLRIEMTQEKNEVCGFTYDVVLKKKSSNCKAYFKGKWDERTKVWTLKGISFIKNSGDHVLMTIKLWFGMPGNQDMLRGAIVTAPFLPGFMDEFMNELFWLRRISNTPKKPSTYLPLCYTPIKQKEPDMVPSDKQNQPVKKIKDSVSKPIPPVEPDPKIIKEDPLPSKVEPIITQKPKIPSEAFQAKLKAMQSRKKGEIKTVVIHDRKVEIKLFDNGTIDNDSVSIFYNGEMLKINERLTDNPIVIQLTLDENTDTHEIVMFAENLGLIAPNTATLVITSGKKRYELHASADLSSNSTVRLIFQP